MPDVLADAQRYRHSLDVHHAGLAAFGEIALLVEHLVVGQLLLVVGGDDPPACQHGGAVEAAPVLLPWVTHHYMNVRHPLGQLVQRLLDALLHVRAQQQVLRRIAAQGQLGEQDHIRLLIIPRVVGGIDQPLQIAPDISHLQVELG